MARFTTPLPDGGDPYPFYEQLRRSGPLFWGEAGAWLLARHADVLAVLTDERFGALDPADLLGLAGVDAAAAGRALEMMRQWMLFSDPPDHARLRALVQRSFTPGRVKMLAADVQTLADDLLDAVAAQRHMDAVAHVAEPLPRAVICRLLGLPLEDAAHLGEAADALALLLDPLPGAEVIARGNAAAAHFDAYFRAEIARRRGSAGDDLLSALIAAEQDGDCLSASELLSFATLLFGAGSQTTTHLIGNGLLALLRHPEERRKLDRNPERIASAVEEMLRYDGPTQVAGRIASATAPIGGVEIPAGARVLLLLGAANRDPAAFPDADRFDIERGGMRHLAFSHGMHFCVGAQLARLEATTVIGTLLRRFPGLRLSSDRCEWRPQFSLRGLRRLVVEW